MFTDSVLSVSMLACRLLPTWEPFQQLAFKAQDPALGVQ